MKLKFFTLLFFLNLSNFASAQLGNDSVTTHPSAANLHIQHVNLSHTTGYSFKKILTSDGIELHEYINNSDHVFALKWSGNSKPNLEILLGKYFDRYHIELEKSTSGRKPVHIQDSDLVIHTGGTMRNYFGTAYLPSEAPVGFTIDEIQ